MTNEEAIKHLNFNEIYTDDWDEAILMAKEALEKQIPKKPISDNTYTWCPNCENVFNSKFVNIAKKASCNKFCPYCGQALDWS